MDYSITIAGYDIWEQWHMIPTSRPTVSPPKLKTNYIEITGMDGSLDYSETLSGRHYGNREGSWEMYVIIDPKVVQDSDKRFSTKKTWNTIYEDFLNKVQGQKVRVILTEDPTRFYQGRLEISSISNDKSWLTATIDYVLEPYSYPISESNQTAAFWNPSSDSIFYRGEFKINGDYGEKTLVNDSGKDLDLRVNSEIPIYVTRMSDSAQFPVYPSHNPDAVITKISAGSTKYRFSYTGGPLDNEKRVAVEYTPTVGFIF